MPDLPEHLLFYWQAFFDLSTERQIGMGLGPIPRSKIFEYADEHWMGADAVHKLYRIISDMDAEYMSMANSPEKEQKGTMAKADDVQGVKRIFDRLDARGKTATKKHKK